MSIFNTILVFIIFVYVIFLDIFFINRRKIKKAISNISIHKEELYMFSYEKVLIESMQVSKDKQKIFLIVVRSLIIITSIFLSLQFGTIAIFFLGAIIITLFMNVKNKQLIESAGINYIETMNYFLDSYIPAISSGLSNDQAMLKYISSEENEELLEWWADKDTHLLKINNKWQRIIEVYEMMNFNELHGISNSLPIINEMQKDLNAKQQFFNDYSSKIGEIKPIMYSYYAGVPLLLLISFHQTYAFWFSFFGAIAAFILVIFFFTFQILIYNIRKNTLKSIF